MKKQTQRGFTLIELVIAMFIIGVIATALVCSRCSGKGIVILEGYEHGIGFCGKEYGTVLFSATDAVIKMDDVATYVINENHQNDPQVNELIALTHTECNKL
jgi:prepilin-type N-terminal cleavage/methylation domain-containing protein